MDMEYSFSSEFEPTDEQLGQIMKEVAIEAKESADRANELFWANLQKTVNDAKILHKKMTQNV